MLNHHGLLLCTRYALPPNSLHYCGPDKITNLSAYTREQIADYGLQEILTEFETLYPYLSFIAFENNLRDPFDPRVVEAYWLGNSLLNKISMKGFSKHLTDALHLKKKIAKKDFELLVGKIPLGAIPHHTFHVLNIFTRTGHHTVSHTLETMDSCRISWGRIIQTQNSKIKDQNYNSKIKYKENKIQILTKPLVLQNGKITLGTPIVKDVFYPFPQFLNYSTCPSGRRVSQLLKKNISFHWNQFCDVLTSQQVANLEKYTKTAINLANKTI